MLSMTPNIDISGRLAAVSTAVDRTLEKLSSGQQINRAADDAGGLAISETLRAQVRGTHQAIANIQDAINLVRIGEDGVQSTFPVMQRIRELVLQASNSTLTDKDRAGIQTEIDEIKYLLPDAFVQGQKSRLMFDDPSADRILEFQVGANAGDQISVDYNGLRNTLSSLIVQAFGYEELYNSPHKDFLKGRFGDPLPAPSDPVPPFFPVPPGTTFAQAFPKVLVVNPYDQTNLDNSLNLVDTHQPALVKEAAYLGAMSNRLTHTLNVQLSYETTIAGTESRIRDADMAKEAVNLSRNQIMQQSTTSMASQANMRMTNILRLIRQS